MSIPTHEELRAALEQNPESLRPAQLMEELFWDALDVMVEPNRDQMAHLEVASSDIARSIFSRTDPGPASWRLWYAGQLQGIAGLLHARLSRHLSLSLEAAAALQSRKHAQPILKALIIKDFGLSDLARIVDLDESHLRRELGVLTHHGLIKTVKEGRERWARITETGRTALAEALDRIGVTEDSLAKYTYIGKWCKRPEDLVQYKTNLHLVPLEPKAA